MPATKLRFEKSTVGTNLIGTFAGAGAKVTERVAGVMIEAMVMTLNQVSGRYTSIVCPWVSSVGKHAMLSSCLY